VISGTFAAGNTDMSVNGGGGNDTIVLSAAAATDLGVTSYFFGDDGADQFTLNASAFSTGGSLQSIAYANAGQSNLSAFDTVSGVGSGSFTVAEFYAAATLGVNTAQGSTISATSGGVTFSNTFALGVTARASALDALSPTKGGAYFFNDGLGRSYLFMQGGSAGTSDDLLIQAGSGVVITGLAVSAIGAGLPGSRIFVN
jgi:hypothetical protein